MILNKNISILFFLLITLFFSSCNFMIPSDVDFKDVPFPDVPLPSGINDSSIFDDSAVIDDDSDDIFENVHEYYEMFASAQNRFDLENMVFHDVAIYKTAYYSVNGEEWQSFSMQGDTYENPSWIQNEATFNMPNALKTEGEHYIIFYSCFKKQINNNYEWNCHGSQKNPIGYWQLSVITVDEIEVQPPSGDGSGGGESTPPPAQPPSEPDEQDEPEELEIPSPCNCDAGYYCANDVCLMIVPGNTYFVATNGDNNNPGNFTHPWASFEKAVNTMSPGDIVYFRGGVYFPTSNAINIGKNGDENNYFRLFNYPGERPIIDGTNMEYRASDNFILKIFGASYFHFKGFDFRNRLQANSDIPRAVYDQNSHDIIYENLRVYNIEGRCFQTHNSYNIHYINSDAFDCIPRVETAAALGINGRCFSATSTALAPQLGPITYNGCRAWNCSHVGFGANYQGPLLFNNSWAFNNGLHYGGGHGFHLGTIDYVVVNSIMANNKNNGLNENNDGRPRPNSFIYNNFAYNNSYGFFSANYNANFDNQNIYRNNIGYANRQLDAYAAIAYVHDHNSWDLPFSVYHPYKTPPSVTDDDFVSLDVSQLSAPRKPDGSLPDITFGHLRSDSDLIDRGVDVGLPYMGNAPDLGAFETPYTAPPYTRLSKCGLLTTPNRVYRLTSDVTSSGTCFTIRADNIVLDCAGHTITYSTSGAANTRGIFTNKFNTTIKNCNVVEGNQQSSNGERQGIFLSSASNSTLLNNNVTTNNQRAVYLYQSSNNKLEGNKFVSNTQASIVLIASHNNFLNNNIGLSDKSVGIFLASSSNNELISNYAKSNDARAMFLSGANDNSFTNQTAIGGTFGIDISDSSNNLFKDCNVIEGGSNPVRISANSQDNVFDNCNY